jgi:hypothetical protein
MPPAPFGGMKGSRVGPKLPVHWGSKYGIEEFREVKHLCMGGIDRFCNRSAAVKPLRISASAPRPVIAKEVSPGGLCEGFRTTAHRDNGGRHWGRRRKAPREGTRGELR